MSLDQHSPAPSSFNSEGRPKVFVSYSRKDMAFAQMLVEGLSQRGFDAFLDKTDIAPGELWKDRLAGLIAAADTVVFLISPDSISSSICAWELQESASLNKRVIPIVTRTVPDADVPPLLGRLHWIFCTKDDDAGAALSTLDNVLRTDLVWVREHTRLGELAKRWDEQKRINAATLRGPDLDAAEQWLDQRPVEAIAPTELQQDFIRASRRFSTDRQRRLVGGSIAAAAAFAIVALGAGIEWRAATKATERADRNFAAAINTVDGLMDNIVSGLRGVEGMRVDTIRSILETVQKSVTQLSDTAPDNPELLRSRAIMFSDFVTTYLAAGAYQDAEAAALQALEIDRKLAGLQQNDADKNALAQHDVSVSLFKLGDVKLRAGDRSGAFVTYQESLDLSRKIAAQFPDKSEIQRDVSTALDALGDIKLEEGDAAGALAAYQEGIDIFRKIAAEYPDNPQARIDVLEGLLRLGATKLRTGDRAGALAADQESVAMSRRLAAQYPDRLVAQRSIAMSLTKLGDSQLQGGAVADAFAAYQESLNIARTLAAKDPGDIVALRDVAVSLGKVGDVKLQGGGDQAGALAAYQESLEIRRKIAAEHPGGNEQTDLVVSLINVARASRNPTSIYREALALAQQLDAAGKITKSRKEWIVYQFAHQAR